MQDEILPMSKSEAQKLESLIHGLRSAYRHSIEKKMDAGGFAMASVLNFDNDKILIEIKCGVQISIPGITHKENIVINRKTMEIVEKIEVV